MATEIESRRRSARRTLALLALVCAAPIVASYVAYYGLHPSARVNYGELEAKPAPEIVGATAEGAPWRLSALRGRWVLLVLTQGACDAACERALYATRQARTIQGREQERIDRVLLQPAGAPAPAAGVRAQHPGLTVAQTDPGPWTSLLRGAPDAVLLLDPLGNLVLRYPGDPDIRRLAQDLERLLKASRIG
jgi:hypothetical protein